VEQTLGIVIIAVVAAAALVAIATLATSGRTYDQIGRGGLSLRDGSDRPAREPARSSAAAARERDDEIRQLLEARNEVRSCVAGRSTRRDRHVPSAATGARIAWMRTPASASQPSTHGLASSRRRPAARASR